MWRDIELRFLLTASLTDSAIQFLEDERREGDVELQLEVQYRWYDAVKNASDSYSLTAVNWDQTQANFPPIPRSRWLELLGAMEWTEIEIFEIRAKPFMHFQELPRAVERMRDAEKALRNGDWSGVLVHCRAALEAAAKAHSKSDDVRAGFELLFEKTLTEHADKRLRVNEFVRALTNYCHLGRHEDFQALVITRSEAEFVFTSTLGLFSFLGRRLAKVEAVGPNI